MTNRIVQDIIVEESTSIQWIEISHKIIKPSFVNYYTCYLCVNFCQRSDKWFLVKCDNSNSADLSEVTSAAGYCKSRKENPQKLTQLSSRSHPRHLVGKRTAQKDITIDTTSDSQVNSNFPNRWSPASLTFNNYFYLFLYLYIT